MTLPCRPSSDEVLTIYFLSHLMVAKVEGRDRGVEAQCLCQRPPGALSQAIEAKVQRRMRMVEAQCLCQRPAPALSQAIDVKLERRKRDVEAQCLCSAPTLRPLPGYLSQGRAT